MNRIKSDTLLKGIMSYINDCMIPAIDDTFMKITLKTITITSSTKMESYKQILDNYINTDFGKSFLKVDENGYFEIETLIDAVRQAMNDCGELKITFPAIKFLSPQEKILTFTANDISNLKQCITNAAMNGGK